jgi:glycerol-1-phosphate dehydrogenase [NAD(P)+]
METPNADNLFGARFDCPCGRTHAIVPREIVYADDAIAQLPGICERATDGRRTTVLMDSRTAAAAGTHAADSLTTADWTVQSLLVPDTPNGASPICDEATKDALAAQLDRPALLLPVGSGVISDLGKWLAFEADVPYVCFATAASMNGYTSANVAPTVDGVKALLRARPPVAVIAAPSVLADAPFEMTAAGLGDVLAKSVSSADWRLNHILFGDYYCERAVGLIAGIEPLYLDRPEDIRDRRPEAMEALFRALLLTGAAMTMAETSAPASGGEHLISHTLDMMASVDEHPHDLHGRQVGVGTIIASELYRRVLECEAPTQIGAPPELDRAFWGDLAPAVAAQVASRAEKQASLQQMLTSGDTWDRLRADLAPILRPPERIRDVLRRAGAACQAEDIAADRSRLRDALLHAHEIRPRFTVLDLAWATNILPTAADEIVETWA